MKRKYFKSKSEANKARTARNEEKHTDMYHVYRMPKGSRKAGWYAVCTYIEYVNTY